MSLTRTSASARSIARECRCDERTQVPEFIHPLPDAATILQILRRQRQPNGGPPRSSPHETRCTMAANLGEDRHRSSPDPPSGSCTLACPTGRLRCSGNCIGPTGWHMELHFRMPVMSWLNLWRPLRRQDLSGLSMGGRGAMPPPPCPCQAGFAALLHPDCLHLDDHGHGAPAAGQEA